jgi:hypothetical protein
MALLLSNHVLKSLQLTADDSLELLEGKLRELEPGFLDIIYSSTGHHELLNLAKNKREEIVEIFPAITSIGNWLYYQLKINETVIGEIVLIPKDILADPPTDAEITLIRAWNSNQGRELLEKNEQKIKKEQVILIWTNAVNQLPLPLESCTAILSLLNVRKKISSIVYQPPWLEKSTLTLSKNSRLIEKSSAYSNLLILAAQEKSIAFFRILSNS